MCGDALQLACSRQRDAGRACALSLAQSHGSGMRCASLSAQPSRIRCTTEAIISDFVLMLQ